MLPTHGALHHVPLGGVAVGPSTARARQALQHRDVLSPGGRNFGQISILRAEEDKEITCSFKKISTLTPKFLDTRAPIYALLKFPQAKYDQHNEQNMTNITIVIIPTL
jgi:hypothetical protein